MGIAQVKYTQVPKRCHMVGSELGWVHGMLSGEGRHVEDSMDQEGSWRCPRGAAWVREGARGSGLGWVCRGM